MNDEKKNVVALNYMRGGGALLVVLAHANLLVNRDLFKGIFITGWSAVDFFFILSGFLFAYNIEKWTTKQYLLKRAWRIYPVYWIYTTIALILQFVIKILFNGEIINWISLDLKGIMFSYMLIPTDVAINEMPILPVAWTLSYEIIFYIFAALTIGKKKTFYGGIGTWSVLILCIRLFDINIGYPWDFFFSMLYLEFFLGVAIAKLCRQNNFVYKKTISYIVRIFALFLLACSWIKSTYDSSGFFLEWRFFFFGIPYALLILSVVLNNQNSSWSSNHILYRYARQFLDMLGKISYSLYLTHYITITLSVIIFNKMNCSSIVVFLIATICSVVVGYIAWLLVERQFSRRKVF